MKMTEQKKYIGSGEDVELELLQAHQQNQDTEEKEEENDIEMVVD